MPIQDNIGNEIVWLKNFPDDLGVENIEIGAGKSYFGKKYFPLCYLLDQTDNNLPHFSIIEDGSNEDCHYLDHIADFSSLNVNGRLFSNIIFCNPYGIGFLGPEYAKEFLNKTASMLNVNGNIHIIGHESNRWSSYHNAYRKTQKLILDGEIANKFVFSQLQTLTEEHQFLRGNLFTHCDIRRRAFPNELFTITKVN